MKKIFRADLTTIYNRFNAWESESPVGLYDRKGKGRKSVSAPEIKAEIRELIKEYPKKISRICGLIEESSGVSVCVRTVQRFLEESDFTWKRIRLIPGGKPDPEEYEEKKKQSEILHEKEEKGEAEVRYYDESGFSLTPYIPYAWQEKGKTLTAESVRSKRLNVAGFMNKNNMLTAYISEYDMNSESLIACIDSFYENSENRSKKKYYNG
ncbi:transposase [Dolichospermum sp. ST_sed1]|nr:transposase [Dolichospermum sp. ST_sed1]